VCRECREYSAKMHSTPCPHRSKISVQEATTDAIARYRTVGTLAAEQWHTQTRTLRLPSCGKSACYGNGADPAKMARREVQRQR
jgi:hypothetical protein